VLLDTTQWKELRLPCSRVNRYKLRITYCAQNVSSFLASEAKVKSYVLSPQRQEKHSPCTNDICQYANVLGPNC
jgi:hypothetical protein